MKKSSFVAFAGCLMIAACTSSSSSNESNSAVSNANTQRNSLSVRVPSGFSEAEVDRILQEVVRRRRSKTYMVMNMGGTQHLPCSEIFELSNPVIKDTFIEERRGRLEVSLNVTALDVERADRYAPQCYGTIQRSWSEAGNVNTTSQHAIEKWESGWRISQEDER